MSLVRSQVFIAVTTAPGNATVPVGKRWLVKYVIINNSTGASQTVSVQVKIGASPFRNLFQATVSNGNTFVLPQPFTLLAGDQLQVSGASASLVVHASGIEFTP